MHTNSRVGMHCAGDWFARLAALTLAGGEFLHDVVERDDCCVCADGEFIVAAVDDILFSGADIVADAREMLA